MSAIDVVGQYGAALAAGDMAALTAVLAAEVVWHQPGENVLSGDQVGPDGVLAHLGRFMQLSNGTFKLEPLNVSEAGNLVAMTVRFTASRPGLPDLDQHGVDVFRVEGDRIAEVWLMGEDQAVEDEFWGKA